MIKKGNQVKIICGKDKGKKGEIIEVLRSENMDEALSILTSTPRSCTSNIIVGHGPKRAVNIELAPDSLRLIDPVNGIISHANHFDNPEMVGVSEPPNPRRHLSEFRQKRMEELLFEKRPLDIAEIQNILKDHENEPQSLCRHRDETLPGRSKLLCEPAEAAVCRFPSSDLT